MVNFNPSGDCLSNHQPEIGPSQEPKKIGHLKTYSKNPASIKDKIISLFTGVNKYIGVTQDGERLYVSTEELSRFLKVSPKDITKEYKSHNRSIEGLINRIKSDIFEKHIDYNDDNTNTEVRQNLNRVIGKIGLFSFIFAYYKAKEKDVMINTLDDIGDKLQDPKAMHAPRFRNEQGKIQHGYTITDKGTIYIRSSQILGKDESKKIKKSMCLNTSEIVAGFKSKNSLAISTSDQEKQLEKIFKEKNIQDVVNTHKYVYLTDKNKIIAYASLT